jgi:hypothetical protein
MAVPLPPPTPATTAQKDLTTASQRQQRSFTGNSSAHFRARYAAMGKKPTMKNVMMETHTQAMDVAQTVL